MKTLLKLKLFLFILACAINILQGQDNFQGIYIKDFSLRDGEVNFFTEDLTAQYRIKLKKSLPSIHVMNREDPEILEILKRNEIILLENLDSKGVLPISIQNRLKEKGVSIYITGKIFSLPLQGITVIRVKYSNIFSKEELYEDEISVKSNKLENRDFIKQQLQEIIPNKTKLGLVNSPQQKVEKHLLIDAEFLDKTPNPWPYFQNLYHEDFFNFRRKGFDYHIWKLANEKDYSSGVKNSKYSIKIYKPTLSRHKFINNAKVGLKTLSQITPYSLSIEITDASQCYEDNDCLGRGLTVRYDKKSRACYAYTLTDDGALKFLKIKNVYKPSQFEVLHSSKQQVKSGKSYDLGIICINSKFYLYFENQLIKVLKDTTLTNGYNGVFAYGKGVHNFDNVIIYEGGYLE